MSQSPEFGGATDNFGCLWGAVDPERRVILDYGKCYSCPRRETLGLMVELDVK
ncbi:hypothetical protein MBT84_22170 [Streptomyces sp. MBT84]|nr:hypothetical protein [Streptomyces sp. MBT84]